MNKEEAWKFCYLLTSKDGHGITNLDEVELVVSLSIQMGWAEPPPYFCASSETSLDVMQPLLDVLADLPTHKFEHYMVPTQANHHAPPPDEKAADLLEVFVYYFIGCTNDITTKHLTAISRTMLYGLHSVYPPSEVTGHLGGDSCAEKKLQKEEARWEYIKEILGWTFNGKNFTIQLPEERCDCILKLIKQVLSAEATPLKQYEELMSKLQH
eukprot:8014909-Ditylum_brightwellii.AAC.1